LVNLITKEAGIAIVGVVGPHLNVHDFIQLEVVRQAEKVNYLSIETRRAELQVPREPDDSNRILKRHLGSVDALYVISTLEPRTQ
jgi:hypothetical protein